MSTTNRQILWVDDEIDMLKPHIIFLEQRGYDLATATSGEAAIEMIKEKHYDIILLDEMMVGMDGLTTLGEIKELDPSVPVVMVTKSEEEDLINDALGKRIDDFLIKPVKPTQVLSAIKRILDGQKMRLDQMAQIYAQENNQLRAQLMDDMDWREWIQFYTRFVHWDLELDRVRDPGLRQIHHDLQMSANAEFSRYVERAYEGWVNDAPDRPLLSPDVFGEYVAPLLMAKKKVYFVVLDCLRLDHWMSILPSLEPFFDIENHHYYSILPTATPYSRNALFSGLYPVEFGEKFPDIWDVRSRENYGKNRYERQLMDAQLRHMGIRVNPGHKYVKIYEKDEADKVRRKMASFHGIPFVSLVYNFIDILSHGRSKSEILQEIAPDEPAFRSLVRSWFLHSALYHIIVEMARQKATVVLTTDHGAVLSRRAALIRGNKATTTNIRYKFGSNLGYNPKETFLIESPGRFRLPTDGLSKQYAIAKEDYYFVYPTEFHKYERQYWGSFQHGGISTEEMILPCAIMTPKG